MGAFLNVKINCKDLDDKKYVKKILSSCKKLIDQTDVLEKNVIDIVNKKL